MARKSRRKRAAPRKFTHRELALLRASFHAGESSVSLGKRLGRRPSVISSRWRRMGLCRGPTKTLKRWTHRENAILRKRVGDRRRIIARDLGRSGYSVHARYRAMKLNSPRYLKSIQDPDARYAYEPWLQCEDAELWELRHEHVCAVAAHLDRSISAVWNRSRKLGIKRRWRQKQKAEQEKHARRFAALRKKGLTSVQIGERFGISPSSVSKIWNVSI